MKALEASLTSILMAAEIDQKFDVIAGQREALGLPSLGPMDKRLLTVQEKQSCSDIPDTYGELSKSLP